MNPVRAVTDLIGDIKGYRRGAIRREMAGNVSRHADELIAEANRLLRCRIAAALRDCSLYAAKVKVHCCDLPNPTSRSSVDICGCLHTVWFRLIAQFSRGSCS